MRLELQAQNMMSLPENFKRNLESQKAMTAVIRVAHSNVELSRINRKHFFRTSFSSQSLKHSALRASTHSGNPVSLEPHAIKLFRSSKVTE